MRSKMLWLILILLAACVHSAPAATPSPCVIPKVWSTSEVLTATDLNNNFAYTASCVPDLPLSPANGGTGEDTSASTGTWRSDSGVLSVGTVKPEPYTYATLPLDLYRRSRGQPHRQHPGDLDLQGEFVAFGHGLRGCHRLGSDM